LYFLDDSIWRVEEVLLFKEKQNLRWSIGGVTEFFSSQRSRTSVALA